MAKLIEKLKTKYHFEKPTKAKVLKSIKNTLLVILGTFILAFGTELFIIPIGLDVGGVSGIAVCFKYSNVTLDTEMLITIITWILFFIGLLFLGLRFSLQTLISTIFYPLFLFLLQWLSSHWEWMLLENSASLIIKDGVVNTGLLNLLSAVFGGTLIGTGCAVTFLGGGSTGGVDVLTFIIVKYFKSIRPSYTIFAIDGSIVLAGFLANPQHDLALCLEGVISAFISSLVIDKIFAGSSKTYVAYIVTEKYEEITKEIIEKIDRTTSIIDIKGGYSKLPRKMVMVSFTMRQYNQVRAIVASNDKRAFMTINQAHEINGEGFKPF